MRRKKEYDIVPIDEVPPIRRRRQKSEKAKYKLAEDGNSINVYKA
jgi:hypothetical protein